MTARKDSKADFEKLAAEAQEDYQAKYNQFYGVKQSGESEDVTKLSDIRKQIVEAQKQLSITEKGELYDPPLKPNEMMPYDGTLLGLDKALRDCRWEMIKIVKEVSLAPVASNLTNPI